MPTSSWRVNYYQVLQVDPAAEPEVIDAAYKRLAAKYHPDKDSSLSASARMKAINAAYETLKDPVHRARYDRERMTSRPGASARTIRWPAPGVVPRAIGFAAILVLLIYTPWLGVGLVALLASGSVIWKHPRVARRVIAVFAAIALAAGVGYLVVERRISERNARELAILDLPALLGRELDRFTARCVAEANRSAPAIAAEYCSCLRQAIRARFDSSSINVSTAAEYRSAVSARFEAALPGESAQASCREQVSSGADASVAH